MDDCSPEQKAQEQLELRKAVRRLMEYLERKRQGRLVERHSGLSAADMEKLIHRMGTDSVLRLMFELKLPLTRETYIAYNWGSDLPKPGPEFELELPEPFRQSPAGSTTSDMSVASSGRAQAPAVQRPVPGGPPMRAPDGHLYVYAPHARGLYQRVVMPREPRPGQAHPHQHLWDSEEELIRSIMANHPGLTEEEARREIELFG